MASVNNGSCPEVWFVSWHNYLDQTNGASISTRSLLLALKKHGWGVKTFCGSSFDNKTITDLSLSQFNYRNIFVGREKIST